ncbi:hypothetical protein NL676_015734 [Syzygium grande]|nr:hypothetical protein NL676_015734 [Syzygium grande]
MKSRPALVATALTSAHSVNEQQIWPNLAASTHPQAATRIRGFLKIGTDCGFSVAESAGLGLVSRGIRRPRVCQSRNPPAEGFSAAESAGRGLLSRGIRRPRACQSRNPPAEGLSVTESAGRGLLSGGIRPRPADSATEALGRRIPRLTSPCPADSAGLGLVSRGIRRPRARQLRNPPAEGLSVPESAGRGLLSRGIRRARASQSLNRGRERERRVESKERGKEGGKTYNQGGSLTFTRVLLRSNRLRRRSRSSRYVIERYLASNRTNNGE